jgi:hypothetical protein
MFQLQETNQHKLVRILTPQYAAQGRTFEYITEPYVVSPPAAYIISEDRRTFTLGFRMKELDKLKGTYLFNILVDGYDSGEYASKIEKKDHRVRILTRDEGWKYWNGKSFV